MTRYTSDFMGGLGVLGVLQCVMAVVFLLLAFASGLWPFASVLQSLTVCLVSGAPALRHGAKMKTTKNFMTDESPGEPRVLRGGRNHGQSSWGENLTGNGGFVVSHMDSLKIESHKG